MAGISRKNNLPYIHCGPLEKEKKMEFGVSRNYED